MSADVRRRPKLGQHFLTSASYRRRISEALPIGDDDLVIEIGAGRGAMTARVAGRARRLVAVELDSGLAERLRQDLAGNERVEVLPGDILRLDLAEICRRHGVERAFAFGNLPYYITSPILRHLFASAVYLRGMAFVVQREVADRIVARPRSRDYGYLSVMTQSHSRPRVALSIPPGAFSPPPAVSSALVIFEITKPRSGWDEARSQEFLEFVKLGFGQKRKKLVNNLTSAYPLTGVRQTLVGLGLGEGVRAEELGADDLARLFEALRPIRQP
ncbi:MAG TPA: 16S rRNA (adenine(1518)-N(6)/adenine(1519)-N(6))-dimethyltransferase RsmA [Terriglobia bacterium]